MLYDISTFEQCFKTMEIITDFKHWKDIFNIYQYRYIDAPDKMRADFFNKYNIQLKQFSSSEISFLLQHVTTSANNCKNIRENGIHDLRWSYENKTELREFLDKHNIILDIDEKHIYQNSSEIVLKERTTMIWYKFFDDPYVCGCFQIDKKYPYGGNVHYRPEIIGNINSIVKHNIEYEWIDSHVAYIISVQVPLQDMMVFLSTNQTNVNLIDTLFSYAFNTVFYRDLSSDRIGILKKDKYISADNIVKIEKW